MSKQLSTKDLEIFIKHYRGDMTMAEAAECIKFHLQTVLRAIRDDPDLKAEIVEARELKRQRRGGKAVKNIEKIADTDGHKDEFRANLVLAETYDDDFLQAKQAKRVEITGADGGPIEIESKVVKASELLSLAVERDVAGDLGIGLDRPPLALPPAGDVRSAPPE